MKTNEMQKVWDALKQIYGSSLQAATLTVLMLDDKGALYQTIIFPQTEKTDEDI